MMTLQQEVPDAGSVFYIIIIYRSDKMLNKFNILLYDELFIFSCKYCKINVFYILVFDSFIIKLF